MEIQFFPVGYPTATQVVSTPHGSHRLQLDEWIVWQQTFISHTLFEIADDLFDLFGEEDTMERQLIEHLLKLMQKSGLVVAINDPSDAMSVLADYRWMPIGSPTMPLNDQQAGIEALLNDRMSYIHGTASRFSSFRDFSDYAKAEGFNDEALIVEWLTAETGTLGFLVPTRRAVVRIAHPRSVKTSQSYTAVDLFDVPTPVGA